MRPRSLLADLNMVQRDKVVVDHVVVQPQTQPTCRKSLFGDGEFRFEVTGNSASDVPEPVRGFWNEPNMLHDRIVYTYSETDSRSKGKVSKTDAKILKLPYLPKCPKNNVNIPCHCEELTDFCVGATESVNYQDDIRLMYYHVVKECDHNEGLHFLKSMMVPANVVNHPTKETHWDGELTLMVPVITGENDCRVFRVCKPQFLNLFGLSEPRYYRLKESRMGELSDRRILRECLRQDVRGHKFLFAQRTAIYCMGNYEYKCHFNRNEFFEYYNSYVEPHEFYSRYRDLRDERCSRIWEDKRKAEALSTALEAAVEETTVEANAVEEPESESGSETETEDKTSTP